VTATAAAGGDNVVRRPRIGARGLIDVVDHDDAASPATPAASVLLARDGDGDGGGLEILMIRRGLTGSFGGMWAFPGGVVEIEDVPPGTAPDPIPAARMAAVREAHEEVGLHIDPASMVFWSHWLPAGQVPTRRFSTWFFLAPAADDHHDGDVEIDGHEVHDHRWIAPSQALDLRARGEIQLAPPTFVTLTQLAAHADTGAAIGAAAPEHFATQLVVEDGRMRCCVWHGDAAYRGGAHPGSVADLDLPGGRHRLRIAGADWRYERT
jgi:8-oxo-dGTP pyrophosphatase MutT (NUDIX family)